MSPFNPRDRRQFFEDQKARKYTNWDVMGDAFLEFDANKSQVLNRKNTYVIDPMESY